MKESEGKPATIEGEEDEDEDEKEEEEATEGVDIEGEASEAEGVETEGDVEEEGTGALMPVTLRVTAGEVLMIAAVVAAVACSFEPDPVFSSGIEALRAERKKETTNKRAEWVSGYVVQLSRLMLEVQKRRKEMEVRRNKKMSKRTFWDHRQEALIWRNEQDEA